MRPIAMLLLLLLLLLASQASAQVSFVDFTSNGKESGCKIDTGYNLNTLQCLWSKYGHRLMRSVRRYKPRIPRREALRA